jgi:hypothetical protein
MPLCDREAEGVGFEPTVDETAHNGFRARAGEAKIARVERSDRSGERLRERNLSEILSALKYGPKPAWDGTAARSRADVCLAPTREELIQHVHEEQPALKR